MMARAGSQSTFKEGREDLKIYAGLAVSAKDVERVAEGIGQQTEAWLCQEREVILKQNEALRPDKTIPIFYISYDGTGVPMTPEELKGRRGKQADGSAKTREAKLGCVFTQTTTDVKGFPVRDPDSTSFVGAIESAEDFGWRIYGEAIRRGLTQAKQVVVLGDGAEWIKNLAQMHFPEATLDHRPLSCSTTCLGVMQNPLCQTMRKRLDNSAFAGGLSWITERWRRSSTRHNNSCLKMLKGRRKLKRKSITWRRTRAICAMRSSVPKAYSLVLASLRLDARLLSVSA